MNNQQDNQPAKGEKCKRDCHCHGCDCVEIYGLPCMMFTCEHCTPTAIDAGRKEPQADEEVQRRYDNTLEGWYSIFSKNHYEKEYINVLLAAVESKTRRDERERAAGIIRGHHCQCLDNDGFHTCWKTQKEIEFQILKNQNS